MSVNYAVTTNCSCIRIFQIVSMNHLASILMIVLLLRPISGFTGIQQQKLQHEHYTHYDFALRKAKLHRHVISRSSWIDSELCTKYRTQSKLRFSTSSTSASKSIQQNATIPLVNGNISNHSDNVSSSNAAVTLESTKIASIESNHVRKVSMKPTTSTKSASTTKKKKNLKMFPRYLEVECWKRQELRGLEPVLQAVAEACQQINKIVQRAQTDDLYGVAVSNDGNSENIDDSITNIQGETQQKLDVLCNTIMLRTFCGSSCDTIQLVASEEEDNPRCCSDVMNDVAFGSGDFVACFDPIDGSKNIDSSLPVGTVFGIYKKPPGTSRRISRRTIIEQANMKDDSSMTENKINQIMSQPFLQDGSALVAAGYCLYSATTVLVLTLGSGVDGFTLDPDSGKFLHTHKDIRIPSAGPIYSFNEANFHDFEVPVQRYLNALKEGSSSVGIRSNARYVGALVADVHNVLINGGIYGYPSTRRNPDGKLRLLYESAPMAMIMEQAGGAGSTGKFGRILNYMPTHIHQRYVFIVRCTDAFFNISYPYSNIKLKMDSSPKFVSSSSSASTYNKSRRVPTFLGSIENVFELDQFYKYYSENDDTDDQL